ncbi:MAG: hypothetical protein DDT40_00932 [candidate division WS2 bacterium]|uniref:Uncharacterized protein n=1 Tax=Psychracetigena formicireducens TaxID=2986056 RepID=A0A9E2BI88_PSYF1|nr:hypothetical protein [Candidatus Psychracetigena formicireducens]MBT9145549.1 hypothetical protein [Candidatus Psychracetigena formicireducens]MBT9150753.1 hypothetical protein [Candidatus Psychracetigena formicireducens]
MANNKEFTSPLVKIHKILLQAILGVIILGLVSTGSLAFLYYRDITRLNTLISTLKEKEHRLQALQSMKETIPTLKDSIETSRKKLFTKNEAAIFQKALPRTLINLGLTVTNKVIGAEETPEPGRFEIAYQKLSLSLRGSEKSFLAFANYLENTLQKEVKLISINLAFDRINLVLLIPYSLPESGVR